LPDLREEDDMKTTQKVKVQQFTSPSGSGEVIDIGLFDLEMHTHYSYIPIRSGGCVSDHMGWQSVSTVMIGGVDWVARRRTYVGREPESFYTVSVAFDTDLTELLGAFIECPKCGEYIRKED
jgi:hypothetical protein